MGGLPSKRDVISFLTRNESMERLEDRLAKAAAEHFSLTEQEDMLNFGEHLTQEYLPDLVSQVIEPANAFLGVTGLQPPAHTMPDRRDALKIGAIAGTGTAGAAWLIGGAALPAAGMAGAAIGAVMACQVIARSHQTCYDERNKVICISEKHAVNAVGSIAHEYAHYVQDRKGMLRSGNDFITEGHARGVERHIARMFAERHDNPAYLYDAVHQTAKELKSAYLYLCRKTRKTPRISLEKNTIPDIGGLLYRFGAHHYRMGVAAMCIAERRYGMHVYRKVLEKDFSFLHAS